MFPVTSDRARVETRRQQGRRVLVASMAVSVAIHTFFFSLGFNPPAVTNGRAGIAPTLRDFPPGIRVTRIVVAQPAIQPELPENATADVVAELKEGGPGGPAPTSERKLEDAALGPGPQPGDPSSTSGIEPPRAATAAPAAALRARFTHPALWRGIRGDLADSPFTTIVPLRRRVEPGGTGYAPADAWAFGTWTTRDPDGRRWGAAPGVIYVFGIAIPTCGGRFDASNCGFGVSSWRRGKYQHFLHALSEMEEQTRWGRILERGQAIRDRRDAERNTQRDPVPDVLNDL